MWGQAWAGISIACYEKYCIHKERKKCADVFEVTQNKNACCIDHYENVNVVEVVFWIE